MAEVDVDSDVCSQFLMVSHLRALVECHLAAQLAIEAVEYLGKGIGRDLSLATGQLDEGDEQGGAFHQRADLREITLPMTRSPSQWLEMRRISISTGR